jgi:pyruvate kinase
MGGTETVVEPDKPERIRRRRSPKIVATLGPASGTEEQIEALFEAGVDVFRLNFSHGSHEDHKQRFDIIRRIEKRHGRPIAILMDLQGPKLRLGTFDGDRVELHEGESFRLDLDAKPGTKQRCCLPHPEILEAVGPGDDLLVDDGKVRLRVRAKHADALDTTVITPGPVSNRKGVNVPGAVLPISALTEKDRRDLTFGLQLGADIVAISFVQRAADVAEARALIGGKAALLSKLEKPQAIEDLPAIVGLSDMVMVARGDLGVESPPEAVPVLQRRIIRECRRVGKPVVVATQMLESMIKAPAPTRAEVSDVANAIYNGADAVMLSAETAAGDWPVVAVEMMDRIARRVQEDPGFFDELRAGQATPDPTESDAITLAARQTAETVPTAAIVSFTSSGATTLRAARERPRVPIIGVTTSEAVARRLAVVWGVHPVVQESFGALSDLEQTATSITRDCGFAKADDRVVITAGAPFGQVGSTNTLRIVHL